MSSAGRGEVRRLLGLRARGPEDLGDALAAFLQTRASELVRLDLDSHQRVVGVDGFGSSPCGPLDCGHHQVLERVPPRVQGILVAHGHPLGRTAPLGPDLEWTRALIRTGSQLGQQILDHFILAGASWRSLRESTNLWDK